jgi:asparagine synthase (glutamine-hydrolysing)
MAATLSHRGPDDAGFWIDGEAGIALGHRRLAIVDLSPAGHQPMRSASGRYTTVYNGEIYNFPVLRRELEELGHGFRGTSDTEVMLAAFEQWGVRTSLERFAGMFAIALWDTAERTLTLVRDRLGKKPLYLARTAGAILFGSELKAFHAFRSFRGSIDRDALTLYLRHNYIPAPFSIYREVRKLPKGTMLVLRPGDLAASSLPLERCQSYWPFRELVEQAPETLQGIGEEEAVDELDRLLRRAVAERMIADVPLGAFLSGGSTAPPSLR